MKLTLLHCDDDLAVIDKPAGLPTHAAQDDPAPIDCVRLLREQLGADYLGVHQRLDRDTSGVLLFARRPEANAALAAAFEGRLAAKRYLALVRGVPRAAEGLIDLPLAPAAQSGLMRVAPPDDQRAQPASTAYRTLAAAPDRRHALLELRPATGRTHQLRVHLAHLGHPVVGDPLYDPERPAPRLMLHAAGLELPFNGRRLSFEAPPPAIFGRVAAGLPELEPAPAAGWPGGGLDGLIGLAAERRAPLRDDPATTVFRLIHGAGDGLAELTVDRAGDVLICSLYDEAAREVPPPVLAALAAAWQPRAIYAKYRPRTAAQVTERELAELAPRAPVWGAPAEALEVVEDGLRYEIRPADDLSVGLYCDMRESRQRVRRLVAGSAPRVLNAFAYTCAFGVAAQAAAPAAQVVNLDLSRRSLEWGMRNYRLNGLPVNERDFVFGDVFDWLARWERQGRRFDLIILDPPSFARARKGRFSVARDYHALAGQAARLLDPGGTLLACCNHAGMDRRAFRAQLERGLQDAGRRGAIEGLFGASAIDYPPPPGQESHLKVALVRLAD